MDKTPRGARLHIAFFGKRNVGKSSLINALTNQDIALVSEVPGTTTDPVYKSMEILPIGPVELIDTAGVDDIGDLGAMRVERTMRVLRKTDLALLIVDPATPIDDFEETLIQKLKEASIPTIAVINKIDLAPAVSVRASMEAHGLPVVEVSATLKKGLEPLKRKMIETVPGDWLTPAIVGDLIDPGDTVVLVVPIDLSAPKGRLILPQVMTTRDILDSDAIAITVKERELASAIGNMVKKPRLVVTDSQAALKANADTPPDVLFTTFSILFARYKGNLDILVRGAKAVRNLKRGDPVLLVEACTHHPQADDIGRVKIPRWLRQAVGGEMKFDTAVGGDYPENLSDYKLIVHCGSCMLNRREMLYRISMAEEAGVPIVNYGVIITYVHGLLHRALSPFPNLQEDWMLE